MAIVRDEGLYEDEFEAAVGTLPPELTRVYITAKEGEDNTVRPEPYGLNPPEGGSLVKGVSKFIAKTAENIVTLPKRAIENSQYSIESGNYDPAVPVEAAMTAITGSLPFSKSGTLGSGGGNVNSNYIDMFIKENPQFGKNKIESVDEIVGKKAQQFYEGDFYIKQPMVEVTKELDPTEKALKAIMDALDGPGAYEAKYPTKPKIVHDWNQVGKDKFEVFNANTGETISTVATKQQAESLAKTYDTTGGPNQWEQVPFEAPIGSYEKGSAMDSIQHHAPQSNAKGWPHKIEHTVEMYDKLMSGGKSKAANDLYAKFIKEAKGHQIQEFDNILYKLEDKTKKTIPITESHTPYYDDFVKNAAKDAEDLAPSKWEKVVNTIEEIQGKLFNTMLHERAEFHAKRLQETVPEKAKEAGYDTIAFRGMKNRDEIKPEYKYHESGAMYSSDSPLLADMYSDYLSKHPGWKVSQGKFSEGATIAPMLINTKNYHVYDAKGGIWQQHNPKAMAEAREAGKVGVIVKNVWDEPNSTKDLGKPATVFITFPKGASTVKSRFAEKFDPESKNMLHMIPVLAVGGAAGYVSKEVEQ